MIVDRRSNRDAFDLDLADFFLSLREIVSRLQTEPRFSATAESFIEPDRHFRGDRGLAVNQIIQRLARHSEGPSQLG